MTVTLPDGAALEVPAGATGADAAAAISEGLARVALGVRVNGRAARPVPRRWRKAPAIEIVTPKSEGALGDDALWLVRHDTAHVLAAAVMELYPGVKISIGPPIEDGFYYDFEFPGDVKLSDADFERIEAQMRKHIKADEPFVREDVPVAQALERFRAEGQDYKVELIEDLVRDQQVDTVSLYTNGPFTDLCRGPHAPSTKRIKAFKLTSVAGAYWRGDADRQMLTRVYGTAFLSKDDLAAHLERLEEARKRDHRKLGRELDLFFLSEVSPGSPFWKPDGAQIWTQLTDFWRRENAARGYQRGPYADPLRRGPVEAVGALGHLPRQHVLHRGGESADGPQAHELPGPHPDLQVRPALLPRPADPLLRGRAGAPPRAQRHAARPAAGAPHHPGRRPHLLHRGAGQGRGQGAAWPSASSSTTCSASSRAWSCRRGLRSASAPTTCGTAPRAPWTPRCVEEGLEFEVNEGDGAFYGPKIDLHMTDSIGRSWQLGTVQLDYSMPERFELAYTGADNEDHQPVMIHRALMGSFERFIGILIEHYAGEFPLWLAPVQALVLPIADRHGDYAAQVAAELGAAGLRVAVDDRGESVGRKIRDGELRKVRYLLVVGDHEAESGQVAVRRHGEGDLGAEPVAGFVDRAKSEIDGRA